MSEKPLLADGVEFTPGKTIWSYGYLVHEVFDRSFKSRGRTTAEVMLSMDHSVVMPKAIRTLKKDKARLKFNADESKWYLGVADIRCYWSSKESAVANLQRELDAEIRQIEAAKTNLNLLCGDPKAPRFIPYSTM